MLKNIINTVYQRYAMCTSLQSRSQFLLCADKGVAPLGQAGPELTKLRGRRQRRGPGLKRSRQLPTSPCYKLGTGEVKDTSGKPFLKSTLLILPP